MKILYFAKFRQVIGRGADEIELPSQVKTVEDLLNHLVKIDAGCAAAFADRKIVRAAVNKSYANLDCVLAGADEVAFFPPVTGG